MDKCLAHVIISRKKAMMEQVCTEFPFREPSEGARRQGKPAAEYTPELRTEAPFREVGCDGTRPLKRRSVTALHEAHRCEACANRGGNTNFSSSVPKWDRGFYLRRTILWVFMKNSGRADSSRR